MTNDEKIAIALKSDYLSELSVYVKSFKELFLYC